MQTSRAEVIAAGAAHQLYRRAPLLPPAVAQPSATKLAQPQPQPQPQQTLVAPFQWDAPPPLANVFPFGFGGGGYGLTPFGGLGLGRGSRGVFDELANLQSKFSAQMPQQISVDIVESPAGYELSANVPGYKKVGKRHAQHAPVLRL